MAGMRDRLIHDYGGVDYLIVWDVAVHKAPDVAARLRSVIESAAGPQRLSSRSAQRRMDVVPRNCACGLWLGCFFTCRKVESVRQTHQAQQAEANERS